MIHETKRVKVHSNYSCNLKCKFCYYGDSRFIKEKEPTFGELKKQLDIAKKEGAIDVDFSGGEPTIRPDFLKLVEYAKKIGFRTICVITNGLVMSNSNYVKKLIDAGLNDVLFSLEGYDDRTHDALTKVPGSFKKINLAIENAKMVGLKVRINITVIKDNYKDLEKFAKHILKYKPDAVNFIKFNPWDVAKNVARELSPKYSEITPHLKKAINILDKDVPKITVRYMPYCFLQGYEKYICNCFHNIYDADEWWIPNIQYKMESKSRFNLKKNLKRLWKNIPYILRLNPRAFSSFNNMATHLVVKKLYNKLIQCKKCKYYEICDGVDKPYPEIYGTDEIVPVKGNKIKDFMFYREPYLKNYNEKFGF